MTTGSAMRDDYASFLVTSDASQLRPAMEALAVDVSALLWVMRSPDGARVFSEQITGIEGALGKL